MKRRRGRTVLGDLLILGYAVTVGFVAGGIVASFYQLVTSEQARFALLGSGLVATMTTIAFCALTGPVIIMDRALKARVRDKEPVGWFFGSIFVAALWSCCSGIVVLGLVLSLRNSIAT
jgi:cytochrome c biogenesis protein CcdA